MHIHPHSHTHAQTYSQSHTYIVTHLKKEVHRKSMTDQVNTTKVQLDEPMSFTGVTYRNVAWELLTGMWVGSHLQEQK